MYNIIILMENDMPMIHFQQFVLEKQAEWGRPLTIQEIADKTGLGRSTVTRLMRQRVTRIDENTIFALCKFFHVDQGQPIPFLIYNPQKILK